MIIQQKSDFLSFQNPEKKTITPTSAATNFVKAFDQAIGEVDGEIQAADQKIRQLVTGKNKDIHGTMIAMEKADVSTRLLLSVRNKMLSSYQEIMRMQL